MIDILIPTCKTREEIAPLEKEIKDNTLFEPYQLIVSCQKTSAAKNRNYCLNLSLNPVKVMLDDDITAFYPGWLSDLVKPLLIDISVILVSARLLDENGNPNNNMGMVRVSNSDYPEVPICHFMGNGVKYRRVTTACIAFRENNIKFNEGFEGSGYEDNTFINELCQAYPNDSMRLNNKCKLIHRNEMKGQQNKEVWQKNKDLYCSLYPWDTIAKNQKWWYNK